MSDEIIAFQPPPLTDEEQRTVNGAAQALAAGPEASAAYHAQAGTLGKAAIVYLSICMAHRVWSEQSGTTEAENVESVFSSFDNKPVLLAPNEALAAMRLLSLGAGGTAQVPKPSPFVIAFILTVVNKSLGLKPASGGIEVSAQEFVVSHSLSEFVEQHPEIKVSDEEWRAIFRAERNRMRAAGPRDKHRERRQDELTRAAEALKRLEARNDVKRYTLRDIASESGIKHQRLRKIGLAAIRRAAK